MTQNDKAPAAKMTCEGMLTRMIQLAQGVLTDAAAQPSAAQPSAAQPSAAQPSAAQRSRSKTSGAKKEAPAEAEADGMSAQQRLKQALEELDPEMALKLRTLMIAGRDGLNVAAVRGNMTMADAESAFAAAARDASENGPLLADYLRRGHALACAAALDLERPFAGWASAEPQTLDERAWLSFGRQLASSPIDEWECLAFVEPAGQQITRLYVKLPDHAWWSFQSVLDRPSAADVTKEKRVLAKRRAKGVTTSSLKALAARLSTAPGVSPSSSAAPASGRGGTQGRALRRAVRAIRARVGQVVPQVNEPR